ncbi:MAG: Glycosyl transferase family 2 [Candidatus Uhrbacteria bacterium GW2011_GWA2_53_10]|uniref:Glycosyl transferase family 2 n=1 Tax=Candidatus Uhrbacteria bacterium GW2011_GWA2_53_10 TaxID=1618980 RepID=A0A0G1XMG7_9BACT|nr:MAG: Glycosyl transferase family 2 [Candidatus Uhrbacteria bacterium GW2011_GWA2_53_10]
MNKTTVSIIIPTLNEEKFLPNLLTSIVTQTEKPFEVIVVDGASKDTTVAAAKTFKKKLPLRVIVCERAGVSMQRNRGAAAAQGEWLIFLDADSVLLPYCLSRLAELIQAEMPQFVTSWGKPDSEVVQDSLSTLLYNMVLEGGLLFHRQLSPGPFTAIARQVFEAIGGYDESLEFGEDQNLSQRLADHGVPLFILRETLFVWSMRRFRAQGTVWSAQVYLRSALRVLFTGKNYTHMPGYIMGGHLYDKKRPVKRSVLKTFETKFKKMMREVFA